MITKGPIIRAQFYWLIGALLWGLHFILIGENVGALGRSVSCFAGYMAIVLTSHGIYVQLALRSRKETGDKRSDAAEG